MKGYFKKGPSISEHSRRMTTPAYAVCYGGRSGTNSPDFPNLRMNTLDRKSYTLKQSLAPIYNTWTPLLGRSSDESIFDGKRVELVSAITMAWEAHLLPQPVRDNLSVAHIPISSNEMNIARAKLQKRITDTTMELAVSLKELPETIRMILSGFQRINDIAIAARRKDLSGIADALGISPKRAARDKWRRGLRRSYKQRPGAKNSINGISGIYLEAVFGWNSMYQEVIAAAEFAASLAVDPPKEKANAKALTLDYVSSGVLKNSVTNLSYKITKETRRRLHAWYEVSWNTIITAAGLNISAIWQVVPYSFIVNWFADITSFVRQFELLNSLHGLQVCLSEKTTMSFSVTGSVKTPDNRGNAEWRGASASFNAEFTTRNPTSLTITYPPLRLPYKTGQYISAIALVAQRITGK